MNKTYTTQGKEIDSQTGRINKIVFKEI